MARDQQVLERVKATLADLSSRYPGRAIEVRIPPYAATQCGEGPTHSRGTPPNVIEMSASTWLDLADGVRTWSQAMESGEIKASGARADLSAILPLNRETL
jgi:hypothetical protein